MLAAQLTDLSSDKVWIDQGSSESGGPVINISLTVPDRFSKSNSAQASRPTTSQGSWSGKPSSSSPPLDLPVFGPLDGSDMGESGEVIDLERYPATIAQTGRDQLEVTVHPQSLTQTVNQEWGTEDADDSDSSEDDSSNETADDNNNNNPFRFLQSLSSSSGDNTGAEVDTEKALVYDKLHPGRVIRPSDLSDEQARAEALLRRDLSDSGEAVSLSGTRIVHEDGTVEFRVDDVQLASTSGSDGEPGSQGEGEQSPSWETVVGNVLHVVQQLKHFAPEPGESQEDQAKHADLMKKLDAVSFSGPATQYSCCIAYLPAVS